MIKVGKHLKQYIQIICIALILSRCGAKNTTNQEVPLTAPVIGESTYTGCFINMVSSATSSTDISVYWYNFSNGAISRISTASGKDPVTLWSTSKNSATVITRSSSEFRTFKFSSLESAEIKSGTLSGPKAGDPSASYEIGEDGFLIANLRERSLRTFDSTSGYLSTALDLSSLTFGSSNSFFAPVQFISSKSDEVWSLSTSLDLAAVTAVTSGSGRAYKFAKASSKWTTVNTFPTGVSIYPSHPTFANSMGSSTARIFGLCGDSFGANCKAGTTDLNTDSGSTSSNIDFANYDYAYYSSIVAGPTNDYVYAHVYHKSAAKYKIVKINILTKVAKEIYQLPDNSLYLLNYDKSSDRLFIGS
ncbi:MAG: hypothetical protein NT027_00220, partial [Proteobacteria bacterium]|nr:hypothetical protein [Pseudomonadota bacterium]